MAHWLDGYLAEPSLGPLVCSALVALIVLVYYRTKSQFTYWEKKGIKGPKPWPIVGNFIHLLMGDRMRRERDWVRQYGKVYGVYQGNKARLVVADAELLQQICVRDFDAFTNHDVNEFFNHYQKSFLLFLQDERWKRTRAILSPTFTSGKIRRMFRLLDACADDLVECFGEQLQLQAETSRTDGKAQVNVKDVYNLFTMDAIATCCYGLKLERVRGSTDLKSAATRNEFVRMALKLFAFSPARFALFVSLPASLLRFFGFRVSGARKYEDFAKRVRQLVSQRRRQSRQQKKFDDYLQLLVDAKLDDGMELNETDLEENHHAGLTQESLRQDQKRLQSGAGSTASLSKQRALSEIEIVSGAMFLLVVGLETTSSLLTSCTYFLAFHPEVQEKLYQEVKRIAEYKETDKRKTLFSYEALTSCQYLDSVLAETLRLFSSVLVTDRVANRDYYIEKYKLHLPKGSKVMAALHATMNDPDYWPEAEKFDPTRFMPGNKENIVPGSYCPFGIGPRHCLGMRFSLAEAKLGLAKTLMKYRFEPVPGAKSSPDLNISFGFVNMKRPNVVISSRS